MKLKERFICGFAELYGGGLEVVEAHAEGCGGTAKRRMAQRFPSVSHRRGVRRPQVTLDELLQWMGMVVNISVEVLSMPSACLMSARTFSANQRCAKMNDDVTVDGEPMKGGLW